MTNFKGTREAFAAAMMDMAEERKDIVVISPDSLKAMRAVPFGEKYPDRYLALLSKAQWTPPPVWPALASPPSLALTVAF